MLAFDVGGEPMLMTADRCGTCAFADAGKTSLEGGKVGEGKPEDKGDNNGEGK